MNPTAITAQDSESCIHSWTMYGTIYSYSQPTLITYSQPTLSSYSWPTLSNYMWHALSSYRQHALSICSQPRLVLYMLQAYTQYHIAIAKNGLRSVAHSYTWPTAIPGLHSVAYSYTWPTLSSLQLYLAYIQQPTAIPGLHQLYIVNMTIVGK